MDVVVVVVELDSVVDVAVLAVVVAAVGTVVELGAFNGEVNAA